MLSSLGHWALRSLRRLAIGLIYLIVLIAGPVLLVLARLWLSWQRLLSRRMLRRLRAGRARSA